MNIRSRKNVWTYAFVSPLAFIIIFTLLGFISPGYDHFRNTVSQLVLFRYGYWQQVNFLQIILGLMAAGDLLYRHVTLTTSKKLLARIFLVMILFMLAEMVFPTDATTTFTTTEFTTSGLLHRSAALVVFLLAPLGVHKVQRMFSHEPTLKHLSFTTILMGYVAFILSCMWTIFFITGNYSAYSGILQKTIIVILFSWLTIVLWTIRPPFSSRS